MFMIPDPPYGSASLEEWKAYRRVLSTFPEDEPGMDGALIEADAMIAAIKAELSRKHAA